MISGQKADYIAAALTEYKKGERKHPDDARCRWRRCPRRTSTDLAAFYEARGKEPGDVAGAC